LQGIYLGFDHLRPFSDEKLYKLWTDYNSLPAQDYSDISGTFTDYNTSTWQLGNDLISAGRWATASSNLHMPVKCTPPAACRSQFLPDAAEHMSCWLHTSGCCR
jgi:hypothetical protein